MSGLKIPKVVRIPLTSPGQSLVDNEMVTITHIVLRQPRLNEHRLHEKFRAAFSGLAKAYTLFAKEMAPGSLEQALADKKEKDKEKEESLEEKITTETFEDTETISDEDLDMYASQASVSGYDLSDAITQMIQYLGQNGSTKSSARLEAESGQLIDSKWTNKVLEEVATPQDLYNCLFAYWRFFI